MSLVPHLYHLQAKEPWLFPLVAEEVVEAVDSGVERPWDPASLQERHNQSVEQ